MPKRTHPLRPFLFFCTNGRSGPDQVALQALAVGTQDELCRPCVVCGLYTGCYCDGNDWGECFAADRLPREHWANNQRTPLRTACDRRFNMCHFCRGQLWAVPPAHRDQTRYAPDAGLPPGVTTSRSFIWPRREPGRSKVGLLQLPGTSISLPRMILAAMTMRSSGRLLSEPAEMPLAMPRALGIRRPSLRRPRPRSRTGTLITLGLAEPAIKRVRVGLSPRRLRMLPFELLKESSSPYWAPLLSMTIPSRNLLPRHKTRSKIFDFVRGEYRSSDVFDRMDVAIFGNANAHTR